MRSAFALIPEIYIVELGIVPGPECATIDLTPLVALFEAVKWIVYGKASLWEIGDYLDVMFDQSTYAELMIIPQGPRVMRQTHLLPPDLGAEIERNVDWYPHWKGFCDTPSRFFFRIAKPSAHVLAAMAQMTLAAGPPCWLGTISFTKTKADFMI